MTESKEPSLRANLNRLSKAVSHALRHEPWLYELEIDRAGWVPLDSLIRALNQSNPGWELSRVDVERMIANSDKQRHEISAGRIRALYGHSLPGRLWRESKPPPVVLFHGTSPSAAHEVVRQGLKPMGRQYVHMSIDLETACQVALRKSPRAAILKIEATMAHVSGVVFYLGNEKVWLADFVAPEFVSLNPI